MKEIYKIKIEPLTAVHIGSGNSLLPIDYTLVNPNNSTEKTLCKVLYRQNNKFNFRVWKCSAKTRTAKYF